MIMKNKKRTLTRRDFIRGSVCATLGASAIGVSSVSSAKPAPSLVEVIRDKDVLNNELVVDPKVLRAMLDQSVALLTGKNTAQEAWLALVKPEDTVGLVATSHLNATHTELVDCVKESLISIGVPAEKIVTGRGKPEQAKACTALISLPALKAHWLTGIGTVMKNYIMFSGRPSRYHGEDSARLGEIWHLPHVKGKNKLVIVDALYPLCGKGPQADPRYQWPYKGLILGMDPVAVEAISLKVITEKRRELRGEPWPLSPPPLCVEAADKMYGLGTSRLDRISINASGWKENLLL
jgi:uncharacterized protein DUF362